MATEPSTTTPGQTILRETTSTGTPRATYILSQPISPSSSSRIDILPPTTSTSPSTSPSHSTTLHPLIRLLTPFLPINYPHSVSPDYTPYQIYDSIQAFASTIAGLLASRAVLISVGVNTPTTSASSTATLATLLTIIQNSIGNFTNIFFAHHFALRIEAEVKFYRFLADVVNDLAFVLDVLSPSLPGVLRVPALCVSSACRAICGVCGGSSKAILSSHFARAGNIGELNAKDGSQETVVSLVGMWVGGVVVSRVEGTGATWAWLGVLLGLHLWANWMAVRSVRLRTLNRGRAGMVLGRVLRGEVGLGVEEIGREERLWGDDGFVMGGVRWRVRFGGVEDLLGVMGWQRREKSFGGDGLGTDGLLDVFRDEKYLLWGDSGTKEVVIVLKEGSDAMTQLSGWYHAMLFAQAYGSSLGEVGYQTTLRTIDATLRQKHARWKEIEKMLEKEGWQISDSSLEVLSGCRLQVGST